MRRAAIWICFFCTEAFASPIVLNEVFYDPEGTDSGFEFVEVVAASGADSAASLEGWVLETGNGARPGEWTIAWRGQSGDRLRGGLFVIGEEFVEPAPDAIVAFDLQNGPDACRLRGPAGQIDLVGWGSPLDLSMSEGAPATDAASGHTIVRLPDGVDTNCNECDWQSASPSPAEFNAPAAGVLVMGASLPQAGMPAGTSWEFAWDLVNVGRTAWSGEICLACAIHPEETLARFFPFEGGALAPGEKETVRRTIFPPPGVHIPIGDPSLPESSAAWVGIGSDLAFTEIFARPANDESEWIEIVCLASTPVDLSSLRFEDGAETRASFAGTLHPGKIAILAPDSTWMRARWSVPEGVPIFVSSTWPSLNHTASSGNIADHLECAASGVTVADAAWAGGVDENRSWERVSLRLAGNDPAAWQRSLDSSGATPGRPNSRDGDRILAAKPLPGSIRIDPQAFAPTRDTPALLVFQSRSPSPSCDISVFDASGILVRRLDSWSVDGNEHRAMWDGRNTDGRTLPLGLYIVRGSTPREPAARATVVLLQ